jgi:hypothetical protein
MALYDSTSTILQLQTNKLFAERPFPLHSSNTAIIHLKLTDDWNNADEEIAGVSEPMRVSILPELKYSSTQFALEMVGQAPERLTVIAWIYFHE